MKKNLYYRTVFRRENVLKARVLDFFLTISSYPRLLIEVFIRKNFGERYFSYATAITITILMIFYPVVMSSVSSRMSHPFGSVSPSGNPMLPQNGGLFGITPSQISPNQSNPFAPNSFGNQAQENGPNGNSNPYSKYVTWYLFLLAFIWVSFLRHRETQRNPSVFDFARFSLYTGDIHPFFSNLKAAKGNMRAVEIFYEPLGFFIAGIILWVFGQSLGWLLVLSSLCYCLSYAGAYERGDNFVMDKIDEMILNEEMENAFIHDESADKTRGVRFYAKKPSSERLRRKLEETMVEEDEDDDVSFAT